MALITIGSLVQPGQVAEIDPYSPTALEDEYKSINPNVYSLALRDVGPAPKMFLAGTSSLPEFTASGIAPESLLKLPYRVRHAAAADPDRSSVQRLFETYADWPDATLECPGLREAVGRVQSWLISPPKSAVPSESDGEDTWNAIFGDNSSGASSAPQPSAEGYLRRRGF